MLLTREQIEQRIQEHALRGIVQDISHTFDTRDRSPTEEQKRQAWDHAWALFPSGGYEGLAAFHNWIEQNVPR